ncbi:unnamed protein product, partial [Allacma fusca]
MTVDFVNENPLDLCDGDSDDDSDDFSQMEVDTVTSRNNSNAFLTEKPIVKNESLFYAMKLPLLIGAMWGLLPLRDLEGKSAEITWKSWANCRTLVSLQIILLVGCFTMFIGIDFIIEVSQSTGNSIGSIAGKLSGVWFYTAGLFVYLFALLRSKQAAEFFRLWKRISQRIRTTVSESGKLKRELNIICLTVLASATGENILFHVYSMRTGIVSRGLELTFWNFLEDYYNSNQYIKRFFSYDPVITVLMFVVNKMALFAWNFGDIILMMISWSLYTRFRAINSFVEQYLSWDLPIPYTKQGMIPWHKVRRNYMRTVRLLDEADKIFYPLIWVSYSTNIFFVCNQLYIGIRNADIKTTVERIYLVWSFLHLSLRTLAVNLFAARINESSQDLSRLLQFCPPNEYDPE